MIQVHGQEETKDIAVGAIEAELKTIPNFFGLLCEQTDYLMPVSIVRAGADVESGHFSPQQRFHYRRAPRLAQDPSYRRFRR